MNTSVVSSNQPVDPNALVAQGLTRATTFGDDRPVVAAPRLAANAHGAYAGRGPSDGRPRGRRARPAHPYQYPGESVYARIPVRSLWAHFPLDETRAFQDISSSLNLPYRVAGQLVTPTFNPYTVGPFGVPRSTKGAAFADLQQISQPTFMRGLDHDIS